MTKCIATVGSAILRRFAGRNWRVALLASASFIAISSNAYADACVTGLNTVSTFRHHEWPDYDGVRKPHQQRGNLDRTARHRRHRNRSNVACVELHHGLILAGRVWPTEFHRRQLLRGSEPGLGEQQRLRRETCLAPRAATPRPLAAKAGRERNRSQYQIAGWVLSRGRVFNRGKVLSGTCLQDQRSPEPSRWAAGLRLGLRTCRTPSKLRICRTMPVKRRQKWNEPYVAPCRHVFRTVPSKWRAQQQQAHNNAKRAIDIS